MICEEMLTYEKPGI